MEKTLVDFLPFIKSFKSIEFNDLQLKLRFKRKLVKFIKVYDEVLSKHFSESLRLTSLLKKVQPIEVHSGSLFSKLLRIVTKPSFSEDLKTALDLLSICLFKYQNQFQLSLQKSPLMLSRIKDSFVQLNTQEKQSPLRNSIRKKSSQLRTSSISKNSPYGIQPHLLQYGHHRKAGGLST